MKLFSVKEDCVRIVIYYRSENLGEHFILELTFDSSYRDVYNADKQRKGLCFSSHDCAYWVAFYVSVMLHSGVGR